jgi:hypothetical protein
MRAFSTYTKSLKIMDHKTNFIVHVFKRRESFDRFLRIIFFLCPSSKYNNLSRHIFTTDSSHLRREGYWQGIWRLKVPPKIKNLVWHICRDVVPTRRRLQDKGVQCPMSCVSCNGPEEDLNHLFFNCPFSVELHSADLS